MKYPSSAALAINARPFSRALSAYAYFVYVFERDYQTVLGLYRRAQELNPRSSQVFIRTAHVMEDMFRPEEALEFAQRALEITPGLGRAHWVLSWVYTNSINDFVQGWKHMQIATEIDPGDVWSPAMLALIGCTP